MLKRISIPADKSVTLEEAKSHLRVETTDEDDTIDAYLQAAIDACASFAGRAFDQTEYRLDLIGWPGCGYIDVPIAPVVSIATVKYYDDDNALQTVDAADWRWNATPEGARIWFQDTFFGPSLFAREDAVIVDLLAGYDPPDYSAGVDPELKLPSQAKAAIFLSIGHLYANREAVGRPMALLPMGVQHLLSSIRIYR